MPDFGLILGLIGVYFAIILGLVLYSRVKETNSILPGLNEFFLAGKSLSSWVLAATFVGSLFSTFSVLGLPGLTYGQGIGGAIFVLMAVILGAIFIAYIGPKFRKIAVETRVFSPVEIVSRSYKARGIGLLSSIILMVFLMPYISLQLVGIGAFLDGYTNGQIGYVSGVGTMMGIVLVYLFLGGMRAVAYTDFVQVIAIFTGVTIGVSFFMNMHDYSIMDVFQKMNEISPQHLTIGQDNSFFSWSLLLTSGFMFVGIYLQPHLLTRTMMAKTDKDIYMMGIVSIIGSILVSVVGYLFAFTAIIEFGGDLDSNLMMGEVFKAMSGFSFLGLLLSGLMLMGALGAAMSTADSLLIAIGQVAVRDTIRPYLRMTQKRQILLSKAIMFLILLLAFMTGLNPPQFMAELALYSAAGCIVLLPTILCFQWKRRSVMASYISIVLGLSSLAGAIWYKFVTGENPFESIGGVHVGFIPLVVSTFLYFSICYALSWKQEKSIIKQMSSL